MEIRYPWILTGDVLQWYLRTLTDYSVNVKKYQQAFLAPLPGNDCRIVFESSLSSYIFKKNLFSFSLALPSPLIPILSSYLFAFLISTPTPATLEGYPRTHLPSRWGESLESSSLDLAPHPAMRCTLMPYWSSLVRQTLTLILDYRSMPIKSSD